VCIQTHGKGQQIGPSLANKKDHIFTDKVVQYHNTEYRNLGVIVKTSKLQYILYRRLESKTK